MNRYDAAILMCVRQAVAEHLTDDQINDPLIEQIAVILAISADRSGAKLDDLVEIVRHKLDQRVTHHANQIRARRQSQRPGRPPEPA